MVSAAVHAGGSGDADTSALVTQRDGKLVAAGSSHEGPDEVFALAARVGAHAPAGYAQVCFAGDNATSEHNENAVASGRSTLESSTPG